MYDALHAVSLQPRPLDQYGLDYRHPLTNMQADLIPALYARFDGGAAGVGGAVYALYEMAVERLLEELGEDAPVGRIDVEFGTIFSDCHKDRNGYRPAGHWSYRDAKDWMATFRNAGFDDD